MQYELNTPCTAADLAPLKAGDTVLLSGVVYTARDQAHKRMIEALDKGEALRALADRLGVPHESTLAVGDSENDRAMLQKAGVAAVMANGMPEIRALARLVSKADCDHDGVAEILETLGI